MEERKEMQTRLVPGVGRLPFPAYRGKEPYIFISYARLDSERVLAEIKRFNEAGFHVWYDEGIAPGNEWSEAIAEALSNCSVFVVMLTPTSAPRENVLNEIDFALNEQKPFLAIYLDETTLSPGLKLRISRKQAILKYNMSEEEYEYKYIEAFTRFGLKRSADENTISEKPGEAADKPERSDESGNRLIRPGTAVDPEILKEFQKQAFNRVLDVDGFKIQAGLLNGYTGTEKNLVLPPSVTIVAPFSFKDCRDFIEAVDLNNAKIIQSGTFVNCPNLHTVKVSSKEAGKIHGHTFTNCPNLTLYVRKSQLAEDFEADYGGKNIVYLEDDV